MTQTETWTIGRLLEWTKDYLARQGAESPRLDAEVLLAHARECQRIELYAAFDEVAPEEVRGKFRELVKRRAEGTPVAYLVEQREFYSLPFRVTPAVLIPRPETEFLVIRFLDLAKQSTAESIEVADVGTGSGILAVCCAHSLPTTRVVALDVSAAAIEIARDNAQHHGVEGRIEFLQSDLFDAVPTEKRFDFVLSNPPYVSQSEYDQLAPDVRDQEPRQALLAGATGTEVISRLIEESTSRLLPSGWLLIEVSPMIADAVQQMMHDAGYRDVAVSRDLAQLPRVVEGRIG